MSGEGGEGGVWVGEGQAKNKKGVIKQLVDEDHVLHLPRGGWSSKDDALCACLTAVCIGGKSSAAVKFGPCA